MVRYLAASLPVVMATACSIGALDGFSGGGASTDTGTGDAGSSDASAPADAPFEASGEASSPPETGPTLVSGTSCAAIKTANPSAVDGRYRIEPPGAAPFEAYCDMTSDDGGWMLGTADMIAEEKKLSVTVVHESDARGGLVVRAFANSQGCSVTDVNAYVVLIRDQPTWTKVRARYDYFGGTACWDMLGGHHQENPFDANVFAFEKTIDVARDMLRMGGSGGDVFDGAAVRCDNDPNNFWHKASGFARRGLVATVRRKSTTLPAGLGTFASCTEFAAGTTSPTYWEYRDVFVR
jgi:hypothetical protein